MARKIKALFDLNIILDVLQQREPFYELSAQLLASAGREKSAGLLRLILSLPCSIKSEKINCLHIAHARMIITGLLQVLEVASIDQSTIEQALSLPYQDFDDAVQMMGAVQCRAEYLVTRNVKDFQPVPLSLIQPSELLALI